MDPSYKFQQNLLSLVEKCLPLDNYNSWYVDRQLLLDGRGSVDPEWLLDLFLARVPPYLELFSRRDEKVWEHIDDIFRDTCLSLPLRELYPRLSSSHQEMVWKHWFALIRVAFSAPQGEALKEKYLQYF